MRLLVVGHPLIVAHCQKNYAARKRLNPSLQLPIVGPNRRTAYDPKAQIAAVRKGEH